MRLYDVLCYHKNGSASQFGAMSVEGVSALLRSFGDALVVTVRPVA